MNLTSAHHLKPADSKAAHALSATGQGQGNRFALSPKNQHEQLVDHTRKWVSQTFFGTLLKQMRESPFKSDLFSGGQGGQAYSQLQDQHLSEHMARGAGSKLVNGIVRRIEAAAAYKKQAVDQSAKTDNHTDDRRQDSSSRTKRISHAATARRA